MNIELLSYMDMQILLSVDRLVLNRLFVNSSPVQRPCGFLRHNTTSPVQKACGFLPQNTQSPVQRPCGFLSQNNQSPVQRPCGFLPQNTQGPVQKPCGFLPQNTHFLGCVLLSYRKRTVASFTTEL